MKHKNSARPAKRAHGAAPLSGAAAVSGAAARSGAAAPQGKAARTGGSAARGNGAPDAAVAGKPTTKPAAVNKRAAAVKVKAVRKPATPGGPADYISRRLEQFRDSFRKRFKADAVLVTDRMDAFYLTGFSGEDGAVLVTPDRVVLLTDGRFDEQAQREAPWAEKVLRKGKIAPLLAEQAKRLKLQKIAFFPATMTVAQEQVFCEALSDKKLIGKKLRSVKLKPIDKDVKIRRVVKDEVELEVIREAVRVAQEGFRAVLPIIRPGVTELDVAAELVYRMQQLGASGASFEPIVASGANAALAHYRPSRTPIDFKHGLLIDWGARLGQYCSDLTRVLLPAKPPGRWVEMYKVCLEAQLAAIDAVRPGVRLKDVDAAARDVMKKAKLDEYFTHSTGHGLGLNIHEEPRISQYAEKHERLEVGSVVTIEPGIYLPGEAGVRIEDDVLVTETGCEVLTSLPKDLAAFRLG